MTKHEDVIKFCLADIKAVERDSDTLPGLLTAIRDSVDTYRAFFCCRMCCQLDTFGGCVDFDFEASPGMECNPGGVACHWFFIQ